MSLHFYNYALSNSSLRSYINILSFPSVHSFADNFIKLDKIVQFRVIFISYANVIVLLYWDHFVLDKVISTIGSVTFSLLEYILNTAYHRLIELLNISVTNV